MNNWTNLIGVWAVLPDWLVFHKNQIEGLMSSNVSPETEARSFGPEDLIERHGDNLVIIPIHGPMIKNAGFFEMFFGFTSTSMTTQAINLAANDESISGIMIHAESPGGHVSGVHELSEAVRLAALQKPVHSHIEDLGASALFWGVAHSTRITANQMAEVGSLAAMAIVPDSSAAFAESGVRINVVAPDRAPHKGAGVPGTEVTDEQLSEIKSRVMAVDRVFMRAVQAGRGMTSEQLRAVNDGRVFPASEAKQLGLVDDVRTFGAALADLRRRTGNGARGRHRAAWEQTHARLATLEEAVRCQQN